MILSGKTALVTGSTSGIGLATARAMAAEGANVVLNGFGDAAEIETIRQELEATSGAGALYNPADLTKVEAIEAMMAAAAARFGGIDILVNNAGMQHVAPLDQFPVERWDLIIALNLTAVFHTTRLALPHMKEKGWGRIINTASAHSLVASPNKAPYVASKHGVAGLTKAVALETATSG
jgi:3-hydroxybutyrate dehydrogenase